MHHFINVIVSNNALSLQLSFTSGEMGVSPEARSCLVLPPHEHAHPSMSAAPLPAILLDQQSLAALFFAAHLAARQTLAWTGVPALFAGRSVNKQRFGASRPTPTRTAHSVAAPGAPSEVVHRTTPLSSLCPCLLPQPECICACHAFFRNGSPHPPVFLNTLPGTHDSVDKEISERCNVRTVVYHIL